MTELIRRRVILDPMAFSSANNVRTPGCHLTNAIKAMLETIGITKRNNSFNEQQLNDFALQGYLWEDAMTETLRNRVRRTDGAAIGVEGYIHLPEISTNGKEAFWVEYNGDELITPIPADHIVMSPDGMLLSDHPKLLEIKWTTKSVNMTPEKDRADWFYQVPCYMMGLSLAYGQEITDVEWHVQFPCGDYRGSGVIYEQWEKSYSWQEVQDRWDVVYGYAVESKMVSLI